MNISIKELEKITLKTLEKLKNDGVENIEIETDNYWIILSDEWDNFDDDIQPAVGSLADDWDSLKKNVLESDIVTCVDIDRLSSILRAISQKMNP